MFCLSKTNSIAYHFRQVIIRNIMQDYTTLNNPRYLYFAELHRPFPNWVANTPTPNWEDFEKCASAAFADPDRRLLPIRDKVSTFHSAVDLFANVADYSSDVFERVKSACEFFKIQDDVAPYADVFADSLEKSASEMVAPTGRFAIDQEIGGTHYRLLPLNDAQDVRDAAHELAKMASESRIHFLSLVPAAQQVVKAAAEFDVSDVLPMINRLGLERCADIDKAEINLQGREKFAKSLDQVVVKEEYASIITEAKSGSITPWACMQKIAALDDAVGIRCRYNESSPVMNPSEIVFSGPLVREVEKAARLNVAIKDVLVPLSVVRGVSTDEATFKLSKSAGHSFLQLSTTDDAKDLSLAIMGWDDTDQRTLLRMVAAL
jgi:hypothetical protein